MDLSLSRLQRFYHVDDFLIIWSADQDCELEYSGLLDVFAYLRVPLNSKAVTPCHLLPFVGLLFDMISMLVSVTKERRERLVFLLSELLALPYVTSTQLSSICGKLAHVSIVLPAGKPFLSRMFGALGKAAGRTIALTESLRADMRWWADHLPKWPGVRALDRSTWYRKANIKVISDASLIGQGAHFRDQKGVIHHFSAPWSTAQLASARRLTSISMPMLELTAIITAAKLWSKMFKGQCVLFVTDCEPVMYAINRGITQEESIAELLRTLASLAVKHNFEFRSAHIAGQSNHLADSLSRLQEVQVTNLLCGLHSSNWKVPGPDL